MLRLCWIFLVVWCFGYCSEIPVGVHLSSQEWRECEEFIHNQAASFFSQGVNYIDAGPGHPCVIQKDPQTGRIYVHLEGREGALIGVGGFKRVTQSILYGKHPKLVARCKGWNSLVKEAKILSKLHASPGIVHMKSFFGSPGGDCSLVLEYYNAGSLRGCEKKRLGVSDKQLIPIFRDLIMGLKSLHAAGYIHRDLHRGNVLFNRKNGVLHAALTDFGLALGIDDNPDARPSIQGPSLPPEILLKENRQIDRRKSEAYSLGVLLYYTLYLERPSWCESIRQSQISSPSAAKKARLYKVIERRYKRAVVNAKALSGVRKDLTLLTCRLLNPDPKKRIYLDVATKAIDAIAKKWHLRRRELRA
jgi:serine/threonine protein kinase